MARPPPSDPSTSPHPAPLHHSLPPLPPQPHTFAGHLTPATTTMDIQPTTSHHRPPAPSGPPEQPPTAQPSAKWDCQVCQRAFFERERKSHLGGSPHRIRLAAWEAAENTRMKEELARRVAASVALAMSASNRTRAEGAAVAQEVAARSDFWKCTVCDRSMMRVSMDSHIRGNPHAKNQAKWEEEQNGVDENEQRIEEAKQKNGELELLELQRIKKEKQKNEEVEIQELQRAEKKRILEEHRKKWEQKQEELRRIDRKRIQEEKQKNEQKRREELQRTEKIRLVEDQRIKEKQQRDEAAASERLWMAHENQKNELLELQNAQEKQRTEWMKRLEEALAASQQMEAQLRIEQEDRRQEWFRKQEEEVAAAAELLRRKAEEEAWRQQELQREHEREEAQRIAEEAQMEMESRRREDEKQQQHQQHLANRLALEQANLPSPGSSVELTGWFEQGGPSTQNTGAGLLDASSEASIRRYLQWQSIIHEMNQQQVWMEQPLVLTFPMPVTSITEIPPILYRVYDGTSVSQYSADGFTAAASSMPTDAFQFKNMVNLHGNWSSREKSPFISVTSTPDGAARQVAIRLASRKDPYLMVALIDTAALLGPCQTSIWKMHDARDHFGLQPWKCHRRAFDHEYICGLRIPAQAIFACCRPAFFKQNAVMFLTSLGWTGGMEMGGEGVL